MVDDTIFHYRVDFIRYFYINPLEHIIGLGGSFANRRFDVAISVSKIIVEINDWLLHNVIDDQGNNYLWSGEVSYVYSATGQCIMPSYLSFKYEEDLVAFKLRFM